MGIAAGRQHLDCFGGDEPIGADRAYRDLVAAIGSGEQKTAAAIRRDIGMLSGSGAVAFCVSAPVLPSIA